MSAARGVARPGARWAVSDRAADAATIAAIVAGDDVALARLFARLRPAVASIGRAIVGAGEVDDVIQETFERLWMHAHRFDPCRGSLEAWTLTIARNAALGLRRRQRSCDSLVIDLADPGADPGAEVERSALGQQVRAAVTKLPDGRREPVERVLAGRTLVQAAGDLGVPEGTLKSRVRAAYATLRAELAPIAC
ncbi:MAG TPA: sigma-70 family RNA polymerase sigma factor [Acidimicrobiales bacterium]|jgi:RNA polymerase sigma-70 factor (ECF subfamily)|nr:sigma-70 family RNA polymerase sigma factor [Acidimicrobiales bacterium]